MEIVVDGLVKNYRTVEAVRGLSFSVPSGSITTLLGPSGCGKTTTLRCLAGLSAPTQGTIRYGERVVYSSEAGLNVPPEERGLGMIFQDYALWPHMRVFDNVAFGLRLRHLAKQEVEQRVGEALELVHLDEHARRFPFELSGGQQQRVAVARAIVTRPQLLLLDEPLSSLDTALREEMRNELLRIIHRLGMTAVLVTHDHIEALTMSDQIIVLNKGRLEQAGAPDEVYRHPASLFVAGFLGTVNVLTGDVVREAGAIRVSGTGWSVLGHSRHELNGRAHAIVRPTALRVIEGDPPIETNCLDGVVQRSWYHGDEWQYEVGTSTDLRLRVFATDYIADGSQVRLVFLVSDCEVIPAL
jgi:ABC-type Fe3+/spermidine/putrescine transport system ATPase subunit